MAKQNIVLESVAIVEIYDPATGVLIADGLTNSATSFNVTMDTKDVRGGQGNQLIYVYKHSRDVSVSIESVTFGKNFLALNVGASIVTAAKDVYYSECVVLDASGVAEVTELPIGSVYVKDDSGAIATVAPSTKEITVPAFASQEVNVYYLYNKDAVQTIAISSDETPTVVKVVLKAKVKSTDGVQIEELQIVIPKLQVSGEYELSLSADGISSEKLDGKALSAYAEACGGAVYAYFDYVPMSEVTTYATIYAEPDSVSKAVDTTEQLTILGSRGGISSAVDLTSKCTYAMRAGSDVTITVSDVVGSKGLITIAAGATAAEEGIVEITYLSGEVTLTETVHVLVTA